MGDEFLYIAAYPCGCIVGALVDAPKYKRDTAKDVAEWIRDGLTVTRIPNPGVSPFKRCAPHEGIKDHKAWVAAMKAWPNAVETTEPLFAAKESADA